MKKRYACLLAGLVAVMLAGCGADETVAASVESTQQSVAAAPSESSAAATEETAANSESTENKVEA